MIRRDERGVVLMALLVTMALMGVTLLAAADVTATVRQREREAQLLFVGDQYRRAIERYYYGAPPGTPRVLPSRLDQLLNDDRYPQPVQHLRRIYLDPFDGGDWAWVRIGDRLAGLHSQAHVAPVKQSGFPARYAGFAMAGDVAQWVFVFKPPVAVPAPAGPRAVTAPPATSNHNINR